MTVYDDDDNDEDEDADVAPLRFIFSKKDSRAVVRVPKTIQVPLSDGRVSHCC